MKLLRGVIATAICWCAGVSCASAVGEDTEGLGGLSESLSKCAGGKLGDSNYCSATCKCNAGEGDCDSANECTGGSLCVGKGLYFYGVASNACAPAHCGNGVVDAALGEIQIDCGGPCGSLCPDPCAGLPGNGSPGHCTTDCPCAPRHGDCAASDARCQDSCFLNQGAYFGFQTGRDMCLANSCFNGVTDGDETAPDCGPSCKPCSGEHVLTVRRGSTENDHGFTVAVDVANDIIVGGRFAFGSGNAHVAKHDPSGAQVWNISLGAATGGIGVTGVGTDNARNVYVAGTFSGTIPFVDINLTAAGGIDVFVLKLNPSGKRLWVKGFGGPEMERADALAVGGSGEVFVTGSFEGTTDFGGGALASAGPQDAFAFKLDANGNHAYSRGFGGTGFDQGLAIAVDPQGNAVVAGSFQDSVDFGQGPIATNGIGDAFVVRLTPNGATSWADGFGSTAADKAFGVAVDGTGRPVVVGEFKRTADFGAGSVTAQGPTDAFVVAYTAAGAHRWSQTFGGESNDRGAAVAVDSAGGVVVVGDFQGTAAFGSLGTRQSNGGRDVVVIRYDAAGSPLWADTRGAAVEDVAWAVALRNGMLTTSGTFRNTVDFGGGPLTSAGNLDVFLSRRVF